MSTIKKNAIYNTIKTSASIVFPLITFPYVNRILLPGNVGKVNFAHSVVTYFSLIAALGISVYGVRECSAVREDNNKLTHVGSQIYSINLIMTIISYVLLAATLLVFRKFDGYRVLIVIEASTIIMMTLGADWLNSAMEDFKFITIRTLLFQSIALVCVFMFVCSQEDYMKYAVISVLSSSGANLVNIIYRRRYCKLSFTVNVEWSKHFVPIILLFVLILSSTIMNNADTTMLGIMKDDYQVGIYSTAHKIIRILSTVIQAVGIVLIPRLSICFSNNDFKQANVLLRKLLGYNLTIGLPCVVGVECLANEIVYLVGGPEFLDAAPVLRVLVLTLLFSLVGGNFLGNAVLIPMKKEKYYMIICLLTAFINIVLNALLIPRLGSMGASWATVVNGVLILVLLLIKVDKRIVISGIKGIAIGPVIGCIAIAVCCFALRCVDRFAIRTILSVSLSVLIYGIVLLLVKNEFAIDMLDYIKTIVGPRINNREQ